LNVDGLAVAARTEPLDLIRDLERLIADGI
jgi:hypothetical protein